MEFESIGRTGCLIALLAAGLVVMPHAARAETLASALSRAYVGNPTLGGQRAGLRATDENVPRALSGYRPTLSVVANSGITSIDGVVSGGRRAQTTLPSTVGLQVTQNLFNGFRTANSTRQAESQVLGAREGLRNAEASTLYSGAQAYMNVLRDTAILDLQRNNRDVLEEQLSQTNVRFRVGEVTRTDVAQAESRLALARSQVSAAESSLQTSIATFRQVIGVEPRNLASGSPVDRLVPRTLTAAVQVGLEEHPAIVSALHAADAAEHQVKIVEGELAPTLNVVGSVGQAWDQTLPGDRYTSASIVGQLSVPIYAGGGEVYARVRQAKETAGQRRIEAEATRDQVRAGIVSAWGSLEAAKASILAAQAQVEAARIALIGVREESRVGQRTTLDILNQQQELLNAQVNLITSQRDRVVASYLVAQAIGRLSARTLALRVELYNAKLHYDQVRDLPWGITTPDGR